MVPFCGSYYGNPQKGTTKEPMGRAPINPKPARVFRGRIQNSGSDGCVH